jgi:hypothetical protein
LTWNQGGDLDMSVRPGTPINFTVDVPDDWTDVVVYHTLTTASYILSDGILPHLTQSFSFQYSPASLSREFPNLEPDGPSDVVTITFVVTGRDDKGQFEIRSRTFTLMNDRLVTLDESG